MIRRIVGVLFLLMALAGFVIAYQGLRLTTQFIDNLAISMDNALQIATETLANVESTLMIADQSISDLSDTLETMEATAGNISTSIEETEPLLDDISQVVAHDVPGSIESLQATIPTLVEVASVIDRALGTLSRFEIDQTIPIVNYRIQYDLGIDYDPEVPFDAAVTELGASLDGMPETLRGLDTHLDTTKESLTVMTTDLDQLAADMATLNATVQELEPIFDEYIRITTDINDRLRGVQGSIDDQVSQIKQIFTVIFLWMGLLQLVPLYLGLEMVAGERGIEQYVTEEEFAERMAALQQEWARAYGLVPVEQALASAGEADEPGEETEVSAEVADTLKDVEERADEAKDD